MAKIPPLRRLSTEDFKDQASWIGSLLNPLNTFFEQTIAALNRGLTMNDNVAGSLMTVELDGNFPLKLSWSLKQKPVSVVVGNTYLSSGATFTLSTAVQVQWSYDQNGNLSIDGVVGITPSSTTKYKLVLQCMTG